MAQTAQLRLSFSTGRVQGASSEIRDIVWGGMECVDALSSLWKKRWLISCAHVRCGQIITTLYYLGYQVEPNVLAPQKEELSTVINRWALKGGKLTLKEFCDIAIVLLQLVRSQL